MPLMIHPHEANEAYTAAHAIAGFHLADIAFGVLVRNGILPKSDAERLLKQAIAANRTREPGKQRLNCWPSSYKPFPSSTRLLANSRSQRCLRLSKK